MPPETAPPLPGQPLPGFLANEELDALIGHVDALVGRMDALPDGPVKTDVFALLDGIDAIHREGLRRLVRLFKQGVLEQVVTDPAIHTLMELYDLLPPDSSPAPAATGAPAKPRHPVIPILARAAGTAPRTRYPHWVPVARHADELAPGLLLGAVADGVPLLLARRRDRLFAVDAICPVDGSPMAGATLHGFSLACPHHAGCHYDVRDGRRLGGGPSLACRPVKADGQGRVLVGLDMDFTPELPSF